MAESISRRTLLAAAAVPALRLPKKIRVGVAGMEGHTGEIIRPIQGLPDVEFVCASDPDPAKTAKLPPGVTRYTDYRQMLEKERLDVVEFRTAQRNLAHEAFLDIGLWLETRQELLLL